MDIDIFVSEDNQIISTTTISSITNKDSIHSKSIFHSKENIIFAKPPVIRSEG